MDTPQAIITDLTKRMDGAINALKHSLGGLRTGRASASMLDPIKVEVYGTSMPITQLATINAPEPKLITVQVWDMNNTSAVDKAIANAGLGVNPISEGSLIRVPLPDLTEERRKDLAKKAKDYGEQSKIAVRNIRRDGMDKLKTMQKNKEISEDDLHKHSDQIQDITDKFVANIDNLVNEKSKDIMSI
jgi:ribosome recycling factor